VAITLKNPASDLAVALNGQTVGGVALSSGGNLYSTLIHPMPQGLVVSLLNGSSSEPAPYLSPTPSAFFSASVQCLVYGSPGEDGFASGETLARGVIGQLHQASVSGYVAIFSRNSQPAYLGPDPQTQRHSWSFNLDCQYVA